VVRFATFNASLNRGAVGQLVTDLSTPANAQARAVAEIIQRVNPDVLLINEFDYYPDRQATRLFQQNYLSISQNGAAAVSYPYVYVAPSNTGLASGFDLNNNGSIVTTPGAPGYGDDAFGFGAFPGQFGMALFSKYPINEGNVRTFQRFLWRDMPGALLPDDLTTTTPNDWYSPAELAVVRLSSKSHWDVPIRIDNQIVHVLVSHPTPPVFDGPEDRNGRRNHDEIRLWADYVTPGQGGYLYDDKGQRGGLRPGSRFVIMGDQNADPDDGDSVDAAIDQLLDLPLINTSLTPASPGGPEQAALQGRANATHDGDPAFDTADFADGTPGNLRADYVLPSADQRIVDAGVFWPLDSDPLFRLVGVFTPSLPGGFPSSDHRLVWVDVELTPAALPTVETASVYDTDEPPTGGRTGDADDPAIWVHPTDASRSLVIGALKDGGLDVYDLNGRTLQSIATDGSVLYNNVDVQYGLLLGGAAVDVAVASDRRNDTLAIFRVDPRTRQLIDVTAPTNPLLFTPPGEVSNRTTTAYGLALYRSPLSGRFFAFVSKRTTGTVAQFELSDNGAGQVALRQVRSFTLPEPADGSAQVEGMVADNELGFLYVGQEDVGIWKVGAEPDASDAPRLLDPVYPAGTRLKADAEGLTIYYAAGGAGYLLASSQGDSTFAVYAREGDNAYLGSFRVGSLAGIDSAQESDGAMVINVPLGPRFGQGLLVVHDGQNDPVLLVEDDGEIENVNTNFKFVPWQNVARAFGPALTIDLDGHDPRQPRPLARS
jgi:myo-inositol-hexaphosphate 3-phosphohydrolase